MDTEDFKEVVAEYIGYDPASGTYNKDKALDLAVYFECMKSTPISWASGASSPHPRIKEIVIKYIQKQKASI